MTKSDAERHSSQAASAHKEARKKVSLPSIKSEDVETSIEIDDIKKWAEYCDEQLMIERSLTSAETKKKEEIVKSMKKSAKDFEKRYPGRGKEVMYATATKQAKKVAEEFEQFAYEFALEALVEGGHVSDYDYASRLLEHVSEEFVVEIIEGYIEEKARGTRKKTTVHAYDVDETLFSHGKKGKPNVKVHVKDESGKRVKSLSNQEFNTHKLEKGHSYDFGEFQSAKKFKETSSSNKKVIKDIKRKQARGHNVHLITARSKFDNPDEFHGHLKKHGINVDKKNIHYTGGMKGGDVGDKKVKVANAIAKKHGASKVHMYDDAAKVHKSFEGEKKNKPTSMKIKTHMVAPDKKTGESKVRSYQATK
ncbi:hypothetical protein EBX93_16570 [bacterium]|nr:hypothetical protein [bacterium]